jgi:hypothetical protein
MYIKSAIPLLVLLLVTTTSDARTMFCKGKWCLPNKTSFDTDIEVLIRKRNLTWDLRTIDAGHNGDKGDLVRRVHPDAVCYAEHYSVWNVFALDSTTSDGVYGICKIASGDYYVGALRMERHAEEDFPPLEGTSKGTYYSPEGKHIRTVKFGLKSFPLGGTRGKTLDKSDAVPLEVFEEFRKKLENPCWYGDCENGFGVKWKDEKIYAGEWENGKMIVSYDSRGRPKDDLRYSPQVKKLLAELTKEYGKKPERVSGGWCYSGTCKSSYGVWANKDGDVYKGFFAKSKRSGAGRLTKLDGYSYVGSWLKGEPHGEGVETDTRGNVEEGKFFEGKKSGNFKVTYRDGSSRTIVYKNDEALGFGTLTPAPN